MDSSEEFGETEGLGLINGKVIPIPPKSTNGDTHLGGDDVDQVIIDFLAEEFKKNEQI